MQNAHSNNQAANKTRKPTNVNLLSVKRKTSAIRQVEEKIGNCYCYLVSKSQFQTSHTGLFIEWMNYVFTQTRSTRIQFSHWVRIASKGSDGVSGICPRCTVDMHLANCIKSRRASGFVGSWFDWNVQGKIRLAKTVYPRCYHFLSSEITKLVSTWFLQITLLKKYNNIYSYSMKKYFYLSKYVRYSSGQLYQNWKVTEARMH